MVHPGDYARNALKRCDPLPEPERQECMARMQGEGTTQGSVASGGILRELTTVEVPAPITPAPMKTAPSPVQ